MNDDNAGKTVTRRARLRDGMEHNIIATAEKVFAERGFGGATITVIAERAGLSKQNLMYYFPTKLALYRRVLDDVLQDWLQSMRVLAASPLAPEEALTEYIRAKLEFSRKRPFGSRVYALEVIGGATIYGKEIKEMVVPVLRQDVATLNQWLGSRPRKPLTAEHLFFTIWAATQSYADFASQMQLFLGKKRLSDQDFEAAYATLSHLVLSAIRADS